MKKLTRYHVLTAVAVVALLMVSGSLVASNMGFKLVDTRTFDAAKRNLYGVALPHNTTYTSSTDYLEAMHDGTNDLTMIVYDQDAGGYIQDTYFKNMFGSGTTGPEIPISPGVGFRLEILATMTTTVVGSQNPNFVHPPLTYDPTKRNLYSVALTPNTKWVNSTQILTNWHDGTNDLTLIIYDQGAGGYIQDTYFKNMFGSGTTGPEIPIAPGQSFDLELLADLPTRDPEEYY